MSPAAQFAWAYAHAYDQSSRSNPDHHNRDDRCPFCREERKRR